MRHSKDGIFAAQKVDGLLWIRAATVPDRIDLIKGTQISNNANLTARQRLPMRVSDERLTAAKRTMRRMNISLVRDDCIADFTEYLRRINRLKIVLIPNARLDFFGEALYIKYETRFNSSGRKVEALKKFEHCWDNAQQRHKTGVMMTLTVDPKLQTSLWDCNKEISGNFNKLLSNITRKKGQRPEYINVFEFQKNGRAHLHVLLFGMVWVMSKDELSKLWKKYGAGEIVHFLPVQNDGNGWNWKREKPKDADGKNPEDYLKKYLKKGLFDPEKLFQYWIYNLRFFSYSRKLCIFISYRVSQHFYVFLGVIDWGDDDEDYDSMFEPHKIQEIEAEAERKPSLECTNMYIDVQL